MPLCVASFAKPTPLSVFTKTLRPGCYLLGGTIDCAEAVWLRIWKTPSKKAIPMLDRSLFFIIDLRFRIKL